MAQLQGARLLGEDAVPARPRLPDVLALRQRPHAAVVPHEEHAPDAPPSAEDLDRVSLVRPRTLDEAQESWSFIVLCLMPIH